MDALKPETVAKKNKIEELDKLDHNHSNVLNPKEGLVQSEVEAYRKKYGYNELPEKKQNPILKFLSYLWGPIPWMIEIAAILSAAVQHWEDFAVIFVLLVVNAVVGFWEEYQAGNTIAALKKKLALVAKVKRDGQWETIPARELVPGDLIRLRLGDIIPADAKIPRDEPLQIDQSALTGESLPVSRSQNDVIYSGSIVKQGEADAVVTAIGQETYFGKTAQLVQGAHTQSHFQRAVLKIGNYLIIIALVLVAVILIDAILRGDQLVTTLQFALVLTVAAIPVAMPTVLSVTLAVGARVLAAKEAIVTRLASIEELAGMDVLCSDKTGTLTKNQLTLGDPIPLNQTDRQGLILYAALASRAEDQDPIDLAVLSSVKDKSQLNQFEITHFQPFDPVHKRTEATVEDSEGNSFTVTKGAPQVILSLVADRDEVKERVEKVVNEYAARGYRALGVAISKAPGQWTFEGVLPLYDPPRDDTKETIQKTEQMGVNVKMVTGDQIAIAREVSRQLSLGTNILDAATLGAGNDHHGEQLAESIETADGFAQVFPEHKYLIVEALQNNDHIVGMTGDGVNDAPALKKADAGIAVAGATDAAREAADIVLTTPGLSIITEAIRESRKIFQRMNNYAIYRIAETVRVLLFMTLSILVFNFYPVTAIMIVLLALLNDGAILTIAYDNVHESDRPERWNMREVLLVASILGIIGVIASFGLFYLGETVFHLSRDVIQSLIYLKLSVAGHLTIFVTRTRKPFWSIRPAPILLGAVIGTQAIATLITVYGVFMSPIGWGWALVVWLYALAWFLVNDRVKLLAYKIIGRSRRQVAVAENN